MPSLTRSRLPLANWVASASSGDNVSTLRVSSFSISSSVISVSVPNSPYCVNHEQLIALFLPPISHILQVHEKAEAHRQNHPLPFQARPRSRAFWGAFWHWYIRLFRERSPRS